MVRHFTFFGFAAIIAAVGAGSNVACSSSSSAADAGPTCTPFTSTVDLKAPTVSFKTDVMPFFAQACGFSSCHGSSGNPQGGLFLGPQTGADEATVLAKLVGPTSLELPSMPYVTPGDPTKSYLMHKIDGDQCQFDKQCTPQPGALRPARAATRCRKAPISAPTDTRDKVRRWIAQGAQNN